MQYTVAVAAAAAAAAEVPFKGQLLHLEAGSHVLFPIGIVFVRAVEGNAGFARCVPHHFLPAVIADDRDLVNGDSVNRNASYGYMKKILSRAATSQFCLKQERLR